jgi:hypothetical protein
LTNSEKAIIWGIVQSDMEPLIEINSLDEEEVWQKTNPIHLEVRECCAAKSAKKTGGKYRWDVSDATRRDKYQYPSRFQQF